MDDRGHLETLAHKTYDWSQCTETQLELSDLMPDSHGPAVTSLLGRDSKKSWQEHWGKEGVDAWDNQIG